MPVSSQKSSKSRAGRWRRRLGTALLGLLAGPFWVAASGAISLNADWRTASRESAGLAPAAATTPEAVIQVYAARAFNWRGLFAVHTWIAIKKPEAPSYAVYQVLGWNAWRDISVVDTRYDLPDRYWYGAEPELIRDLRGTAAESVIPAVEAAVRRYPHAYEYRLWPGPNSNTFVAYVTREVPELGAALPVTAIGKDYFAGGAVFGPAPSGRGVQFSLGGALGVLASALDGFEVNLFGLVFGLDPWPPALKLPGIGRIGMPRTP